MLIRKRSPILKQRKVRLLVAGSREYRNSAFVFERLDHLTKNLAREELVVISGLAKGPDSIAIAWAKARGLDWTEFPADWDAFGKRAGYLRNEEMGALATHCVVFWDGVSRGTLDMIRRAKAKGLVLV